mgnify:CR=1 FL=1
MANNAILETKLKSLPFLHRGKVRDLYAVGDDKLLVVQTDRLSAFDVILSEPIPGKGAVLTAFYMSRQMCYVFFGEHRGEHHAHHPEPGEAHTPSPAPLKNSKNKNQKQQAAKSSHTRAAEKHSAHDPHESPAVMTVPLVILAICSVLLVLIVELVNSAIEAVTDRISLEDHVLAKRAKDMGSAAVMLSLINVVAVWLIIAFG